MLRSLYLEKFNPFQNQIVEFSNITVLTGGNNTGKSSVIEALLMIRRSHKLKLSSYPLGIPLHNLAVHGWYQAIKQRAIQGHTKLRIDWSNPYNQLFFSLDYQEENLINYLTCNSHRIFATQLFDLTGFRFNFFPPFIYFDAEGIDQKYPQELIKWLKFIIPDISDEDLNNPTGFSLLTDPPYELSSGAMYVTGLLLDIFSMKRKPLVIIEHPEMNLHPIGQIRLTEFLVYLANKGYQIILETHSDHIINGFRLAAKRRHINPTELKFNHFKKDKKSIVVESPVLNDDGRFDFYPEGFLDEWDKILEKLL
jgi:hypothetical protein